MTHVGGLEDFALLESLFPARGRGREEGFCGLPPRASAETRKY